MLARNSIFFVLTLSFTLAVQARSADMNEVAQNLARSANGVKTFAQLAENMELFGMIQAQDREEIFAWMKKEGVDPQDAIPPVAAQGNELNFGKSVRLILESPTKMKTGAGAYLTPQKAKSIPLFFASIVKQQLGRPTSLYRTLIEREANAAGGSAIANAVASGFLGLTGTVMMGSMWLHGHYMQVQNWVNEGKIQCEKGEFVATTYVDTVEDIPATGCGPGSLSMDGIFRQVSPGFCEIVGRVGARYFQIVDASRGKPFRIREEYLKQKLGNQVPKCTPALAEKMTLSLYAEMKTELAKVRNNQPSKVLHPESEKKSAQ